MVSALRMLTGSWNQLRLLLWRNMLIRWRSGSKTIKSITVPVSIDSTKQLIKFPFTSVHNFISGFSVDRGNVAAHALRYNCHFEK